jgi:hypothetical protein
MWETYKKGNSTHYKECVKFAEKFKNFKNYVMSDGIELLTPLTWYIGDHSGNILIDYAGKNENLQNDFDTICDKIGIPKQKLPYKNKSKHKHYTEFYDEETRSIVAEKYAKDIEYFGYEFDK